MLQSLCLRSEYQGAESYESRDYLILRRSNLLRHVMPRASFFQSHQRIEGSTTYSNNSPLTDTKIQKL